MPYSSWLPAQAPPWLADPNGAALLQREGEMLDEYKSRLLQGILARFPLKGSVDANGTYGLGPSDALDAIGKDRGLPRATTESADNGGPHDLAYATRLWNAWTAYDYAGSAYGVLRALQVAGFTSPNGIIVQDNGRWFQLTGSAGTVADMSYGNLAACCDRGGAPGWSFDLQTNFWPRFGIVYTSMPTALNSASAQTAHNNVINAWRPGKANFMGTWVITTARILGFGTSPTTLPVIGATPVIGGARTFIGPTA